MRKYGDGWGTPGTGRFLRRVLAVLVGCSFLFLTAGCLVAPNPISEEEQWDRTLEDTASVFWGQDAPLAPISLPEAIARAVKYNLDHKLSLMEGAFHMQQLDVANLAMLPRLAVNAGYSWRSNESASSSMSFYKRTESLEPSFSTETHHTTADLSFSWTLLDFGLSYFQARQQADRFMIVKERRRRVVNNLIKDVIADYFRVATMERVAPQIKETLAKAEAALETYRKIEEEKKGPLLLALENQRALVSIISHLRQISMQMSAAKARLAALMNLPLSSNFAIVIPGDDELKPPTLTTDLNELETIGIYLRPDLREELYQARIDKYEVKKDILKMVPGINLFSSLNHDSNRYLVHEMWAEAGARVTMDIIGMASKLKQVKASKTQQQVGRQRRLASTIAAMVQINMSYYQYEQALEMYRDSEKLKSIDDKLLDISKASAKAKETGALDQVRQAAVALNSRLDRDRYLIDALSAWSNLYFSIGGDVMGDMAGTEEVATLTCAASEALTNWLSGVLPELPGPAPMPAGGMISEPYYLTMATLPPVLAPSEEIRKEAAEEAKKREEEEKKDAGKNDKAASREAEKKDAADTRDRARPEREAALERRRKQRQKAEEKTKKPSVPKTERKPRTESKAKAEVLLPKETPAEKAGEEAAE